MKKNNKYIALLLSALVAALSFGCDDMELDTPPIKTIDENAVLTIADLREICPAGSQHTFVGDSIVFGVVTMDESSGNIYKKLYIQDVEQAVELRLTASSRIREGDSIRVNLKGSTLGYYNLLFQVDSLDLDNVVVQASGLNKEPVLVTIAELEGMNFSTEYQSKLVRIENVQFKSGELDKTYADAANQTDKSRTLQDSVGDEIIVRTSGFASFAGTQVAQGSGTITAIVTQYYETRQLVIRRLSEVELDEERF
ncbi:MAG TPA: DUF5689 domain-containing protein [Perlabentimonas sp.]|jgi:hypothetical protein|nr:DUF5689 domain-containing protein [Bacteroidales bacterium]MDD4673500.1 DUF5689 domain-containing protein [Bacteroidales bacterium]HZJ74754.1 DUF5689 domain-containing protein [Perlabentimonas sp.]